MPTPTGHHPEPHPRRRFGRGAAIAIVVASLATLGVVILMMSANPGPIRVESIPAQPDPSSEQVAASVGPEPAPAPPSSTAPTPAPAPTTPGPTPAPSSMPPAPQSSEFAIDARGFVDSARCDPGQRAIAIARTERSTMVICELTDGSYEYHGVRLRDGASLELDDVRPMSAGFEVRNGGTTYRLSPTELVVISGEELQSRDPMVEYRTE